MAYDGTRPADNDYIADGPGLIRENFRALKDDKIVNAQKLQDLSPGNASGNIPINNGTVCTNLNADKLDGNDASAFATSGHTHSAATTSSDGFMSNTDKQKLNGIAAGAEVNQNAFSNVLVGSTTIQADSKTDTLEIVNGANITVTPDATNDRITIAVTGTVPTAATCTGNAATATNATNHINASSGAHAASAISCTATGDVAATNVQAALAELASEKVPTSDVVTTATANKLLKLNASGVLPASITGNAATATKLATARTISLTGAVTGSGSFDGSSNVSITTAAGSVTSIVASGRGTNYYWRKWSNGDMEQWGRVYVGDINTDYSGSVTFPVTFTNACQFILPALENYVSDFKAFDAVVAITNISASGCTFTIQEYDTSTQNLYFVYYAIGN